MGRLTDADWVIELKFKKHKTHRDGIVEQRLAKHDDVQHLVDVDLLEHGQHRDRIDGRDERRKQEHVQERQVHPEDSGEAAPPQGEAWWIDDSS